MRRVRIPYRREKVTKKIVIFSVGVEQRYISSVYKTQFKMRKQLWYDELADSDPFTPSCPHLHSIDRKYKLNVYTGEIYVIREKKISGKFKVPKKELQILWSDPQFLIFADKMRKLYYERFPNSCLPSIPEFK